MNHLLAKYKPVDITAEEWEKLWNNAHYTLEPLANVIQQLINEARTVQRNDFDCPNHYARLAWEGGMQEAYSRILKMLPVLKD